jgi:hypothetical protein
MYCSHLQGRKGKQSYQQELCFPLAGCLAYFRLRIQWKDIRSKPSVNFYQKIRHQILYDSCLHCHRSETIKSNELQGIQRLFCILPSLWKRLGARVCAQYRKQGESLQSECDEMRRDQYAKSRFSCQVTAGGFPVLRREKT